MRVKNPFTILALPKVKVKITKIDRKTNRISASIKALTEDPYKI